MLPVTVQFIVAMLAYALDERMARKGEHLREQNRVLKEALHAATGKSRIPLTNEQRRRLATKGRAQTPAEREECCQIVRPSTILAWFRQLIARKYDSSGVRKPGRPRKANEIRESVLRIAAENPGWGYTKIRDALRGLRIEIGRTTVANILLEAGIEPAPERTRKRTGKHFLRSHSVPRTPACSPASESNTRNQLVLASLLLASIGSCGGKVIRDAGASPGNGSAGAEASPEDAGGGGRSRSLGGAGTGSTQRGGASTAGGKSSGGGPSFGGSWPMAGATSAGRDSGSAGSGGHAASAGAPHGGVAGGHAGGGGLARGGAGGSAAAGGAVIAGAAGAGAGAGGAGSVETSPGGQVGSGPGPGGLCGEATTQPGELPMATASRVTGAAPLAVHFSVVGSGTGITQPEESSFNNGHYAWNFGDADAGVWATDGQDRNCATGFVAGHVFERPGTYVVRLSATPPGGDTEYHAQQIEVTDPVADGWTTYYVAADGSDAEDGTTEATALRTVAHAFSLATPNTRILFRRGGAWQSEPLGLDAEGPGLLGAYGEGDAPVIEFPSGPGLTFHSGTGDWRFVGLRWVGPGSEIAFFSQGKLSQLLMWNMIVERWGRGIVLAGTCGAIDQVAVGATIIHDIGYEWPLYLGGSRSFLQGSVLDRERTAGSVTLRNWCPRGFSATHNQFAPAGKRTILLHSETGLVGDFYSRDVVMADNVMAGGEWTVDIGPHNVATDERVEHVLYERNVHLRDARTSTALMLSGSNVTVRNNLFINDTGSSFTPVRIEQRGSEPPPSNNRIYHNTFFAEQGTITPVSIASVASDTDIRNNLLAPATEFPIDGSGAGLSASNNLAVDDSVFVGAGARDFSLLPGSAPVNAGTDLGVLVDLVGTFRDDRPDVGALELASP